jgi:L-fuconolactonase
MRLFDTHAHFYTTDESRYPLVGGGNTRMSAASLREKVFGNPMTAERMLAWWDENEVAAGVGVQYRSAYGTDNAYLLDVCKAHPGRVSPVVILDAHDEATPRQLRELISKGAVGVRFTGYRNPGGDLPWLDSPEAKRSWRVANDAQLAVVLMTLPPGPSPDLLTRVAALASEFPGTRIVLDHAAWPAYEGAPGYGLTPEHVALVRFPNVFFKLTSILFTEQANANLSSAAFVRHLADTFGASRLMWGSDMGNTPGTYGALAALARESAKTLNPAESNDYLYRTGALTFAARGAKSGG